MNRRFELCDSGKNHCDFCGDHQWTGLWHADASLILICRECALKVLPALFADATWYPSWRQHAGAQHLATFEANYWRAQVSNAYRRLPDAHRYSLDNATTATQRKSNND